MLLKYSGPGIRLADASHRLEKCRIVGKKHSRDAYQVQQKLKKVTASTQAGPTTLKIAYVRVASKHFLINQKGIVNSVSINQTVMIHNESLNIFPNKHYENAQNNHTLDSIVIPLKSTIFSYSSRKTAAFSAKGISEMYQ